MSWRVSTFKVLPIPKLASLKVFRNGLAHGPGDLETSVEIKAGETLGLGSLRQSMF